MADHHGRQSEEDSDIPVSSNKAPMKLSFTVSKSSSSARPPRFPKTDDPKGSNAGDVEFVSVFDGIGRETAQAAVKVIPLPQNSWRPEKRMKNIMFASENLPATADMFEMETLEAGPRPDVQYGLQLKRKSSDSAENGPERAVDSDLQRYREDVAVLPNESSVDDYDNIPVEEFAKAVMRGMGWEEGKPIGRNSTKVAQPVVAVRRDGRQGLGAIPAPKPEKVKKFIKPGESREKKLTVGRIMCIVAGTNAGYRGQIAKVHGDYYTVVLLESGRRLRLKEGELAEVGSVEEEKARKKLAALHINNDNGTDETSRCSSDEGRTRHDIVKDERRDQEVSPHTMDGSEKKNSVNDKEMKSKHRSYHTKEDPDHGKERRHTSRKESREGNDNNHERGKRDERSESRHQKHSSRKYDGHDVRKERSEYAASSRHGERAVEVKPSSKKIRDEKNELESSYEKERRSDLRGDLPGLRVKNEMIFHEDNMSAKHEMCSEDSLGQSGRRIEPWLARDIRVRVIDRKAYGERFFLQKACVVDVVSPLLCDIRMDEGGEIIQKVKQEHLETALPKRGGCVLVVGGKYRGQVGTLKERDLEKGIGLVQMEDNYDVISFDLDYLAEFVGVLQEMDP